VCVIKADNRYSVKILPQTREITFRFISHSCIARSKRDGTRAETRFGLSAKRASPFKSAGVSVQSTAGSQGVRISGKQLYRPCSDVQCKTTGYPLHSHLSPSLPLPCVTVCHQVLNALYHTTHFRIDFPRCFLTFCWPCISVY